MHIAARQLTAVNYTHNISMALILFLKCYKTTAHKCNLQYVSLHDAQKRACIGHFLAAVNYTRKTVIALIHYLKKAYKVCRRVTTRGWLLGKI
jgi:hypothetical protein